MGEQLPRASEEWQRHWPMVCAAMVGMSFYTVVTYSFGTFIQPLEKAFHWSRAEISVGLTIFAVIATIGGPFVGALLDRVGTRKLAIFGTIASGAAFAGFSLANGALTQWYILWVVFGLAALFIKSTIWSAGVSSVFSTSRGLALAAVLSGSAVGQTLAPIFADRLIGAYGWQAAYRWLGCGWAGFALVLLILFFRDARALGQRAVAVPGAATVLLPGLTFAEGMRDSRIIRILVANVLMSMVGSGVSVHLVPLISETGLARSSAVEVAASAGIAGLVGKFLTGWLLDRYQSGFIPFFSFGIAALGHFLLLNLFHTVTALTAGAMILGYSAGAGLQCSTYLVSRYGGLKAFGALFGTISSAMMLGTALGPVIAGKVHDVTGSYDALLMTAMPVMLLSALLFIRLGRYPVFTSAPPGELPAAA
ncbi:MAG: MFS transporter [Novosphingobium sp.]